MSEVIKKALTDKSARNAEVLRAVATDNSEMAFWAN